MNRTYSQAGSTANLLTEYQGEEVIQIQTSESHSQLLLDQGKNSAEYSDF